MMTTFGTGVEFGHYTGYVKLTEVQMIINNHSHERLLCKYCILELKKKTGSELLAASVVAICYGAVHLE